MALRYNSLWLAASAITTVAGTPWWLFEDNSGAGGPDDSANLDKTRNHVVVTHISGAQALHVRVAAAASTSLRTYKVPSAATVPIPVGAGDRVSIVAADGATTVTFEARQFRQKVAQ